MKPKMLKFEQNFGYNNRIVASVDRKNGLSGAREN